MQVDRRDDTVTVAQHLIEIRCQGTLKNGDTCNRILFRTTSKPLKQGGLIEVKCGKCEKVSFLLGAPQ